jgi:cytochrome c oxidase cbb3-type subunit I/II
MSKDELKASVLQQGRVIAADLRQAGAEVEPDREIVALISYLQKLGRSEEVKPGRSDLTSIPNK